MRGNINPTWLPISKPNIITSKTRLRYREAWGWNNEMWRESVRACVCVIFRAIIGVRPMYYRHGRRREEEREIRKDKKKKTRWYMYMLMDGKRPGGVHVTCNVLYGRRRARTRVYEGQVRKLFFSPRTLMCRA